MPSLTFLGAARTVTGSKHLLEVDGQRILFDCGLFQGLKELRAAQLGAAADPPDTIDAVVLTHAHIDHTGWLPRLVAQGFKGPIYCTGGTADLCKLVLPDAAHLQEEDAKFANKRGFSQAPTRRCRSTPRKTPPRRCRASSRRRSSSKIAVVPGIEVEFINAGHLLGSSYVLATRTDKSGGRILFGGDLGRYCAADPSGSVARRRSRRAAASNPPTAIAFIRTKTMARRWRGSSRRRSRAARQGDHSGVCDRPRRRAALLAVQARRRRAGLPTLPIYVDSPMALKGIEFYNARTDELDKEIVAMRAKLPRFTAVNSALESKALVEQRHAGGHHRVERHGHRRPRRAPPVRRPARPAKHRAVRRFPGGRHARPPAGRRCTVREDVRPTGAGPRAE